MFRILLGIASLTLLWFYCGTSIAQPKDAALPNGALPLAVTPVIMEMSRLYPELTIEVTSDDGLVDIVAAGFDAGIRLGEMIAQDMVAVRLTKPFQAVMVAAPAYLEARGAAGDDGDTCRQRAHGARNIICEADDPG